MIKLQRALNQQQRWGLTLGLAVVVTGLVYFTLPHRQWSKLQHIQDEVRQQAQLSQSLTGIEDRLKRLQQNHQQLQDQLAGLEAGCCTDDQARSFFDNLNTWARESNLLPVSRSLSPVSSLMNLPQGTMWTQAADVVLEGSFYDMIDYLNRLVDRPQGVGMHLIRISMPPG